MGPSMPRTFVAQVSDPQAVFASLQGWARANGFALNGNAAGGSFRGRPGGLAGAIIGEISGTYSASGNMVTIQTDKDLPAGEVSRRLAQFGLRLVQSG